MFIKKEIVFKKALSSKKVLKKNGYKEYYQGCNVGFTKIVLLEYCEIKAKRISFNTIIVFL